MPEALPQVGGTTLGLVKRTKTKENTMMKHCLTVLLLSLCLALPMTANAATVRYVINDGTFNDGGTFSGFFDYDSGTDSITTYELSVSGGNTGTFSAFTYSGTQADRGGRLTGSSPQIQFWNFGEFSERFLTLGFRDGRSALSQANDLSDGVNFSLVTGNIALETIFRGLTSREVTGGTAIATNVPAPVPLPAGLPLILMGFAGFAGLGLFKQRTDCRSFR